MASQPLNKRELHDRVVSSGIFKLKLLKNAGAIPVALLRLQRSSVEKDDMVLVKRKPIPSIDCEVFASGITDILYWEIKSINI